MTDLLVSSQGRPTIQRIREIADLISKAKSQDDLNQLFDQMTERGESLVGARKVYGGESLKEAVEKSMTAPIEIRDWWGCRDVTRTMGLRDKVKELVAAVG